MLEVGLLEPKYFVNYLELKFIKGVFVFCRNILLSVMASSFASFVDHTRATKLG